MKKKSKMNPHVAFFHQNEGLLFQFLLNECFLTLQSLQEKPCSELINKLAGSSSQTLIQTHPWSFPFGHLPKLQFYLSLFLTNFADSHRLIFDAVASSLDRADMLIKHFSNPSFTQAHAFRKTVPPLRREIKKIINLLFEKVPFYLENEYVLFFLLRSHEKIESLYGEPIVAKLFSTLFEGGIKQAGHFLQEQYTRNGFSHLLPFIHKKVESLEATLKKKASKKSAAKI